MLTLKGDLWKKYFDNYSSLIFQGFNSKDIERAKQENKTAIFFGLQNCSPIEDNIEYVEVLKKQGVLFMQLTYNNQSLLATGCYEKKDAGITRMGREVIKEMNRVKMIIDMSHSAELSTLEAIEISQEPIVVSHANPSFWHKGLRNKSDTVLKELNNSGGMIGFSIYPHHLKGASECTLDSFCEMVAETTKKYQLNKLELARIFAFDILIVLWSGCETGHGLKQKILERVAPIIQAFPLNPLGLRTLEVLAI